MSMLARAGIALSAVIIGGEARAGTFVFAESAAPVDVITHPRGYDGTGGELVNKVCFNSAVLPVGVIAADAEAALLKAIRTWNQQRATTGNLSTSGTNNDIVDNFRHDFESTVLHEIGHCLGLGHPNLASESGLVEPIRNSTKTRRGGNQSYDIDRGVDLLYGSADDVRGDDDNLLWFDTAGNDPVSMPDIVDVSTVSRDLARLPAGHAFAANGDRSVLLALGYADTESVMQQGQVTDEVQRRLTAEELRTLRLAMAGLDGMAGTGDDYTIRLEYGGQVQEDVCDINVRFGAAALGTCASTGEQVSGAHYRLTSASLRLGSNILWHFSTARNTETKPGPVTPALPASGQSASIGVLVSRLSAAMTGGPSGRFEVTLGSSACSGTLSVGDPQSTGSCTLMVPGSDPQPLSIEYLGHRGFDASSSETTLQVARAAATVTITSHAPEPSTTDEPYVVAVTVAGGAGPTPTGTVGVEDGSAGCTLTLSAGGGSCAVSPSGAGTRTVRATYRGDAVYATGTASVVHTVLAGSRIYRDGFEAFP